MAKLFVVGIPKIMSEIELLEMFSFHGAVKSFMIATDKETRESKGYGFVTMTDGAGAERAINALDGSTIGERTIHVRIANEKVVHTPQNLGRPNGGDRGNAPKMVLGKKPKRPRKPK